MKLLLDENFPLQLYHRLKASGFEAEHIIILGQRGVPDSELRKRLMREELVFLTQDTEFERLDDCKAIIIISRGRQNEKVQRRVEIWFKALEGFLRDKPTGKLFDLLETGKIMPWETR